MGKMLQLMELGLLDNVPGCAKKITVLNSVQYLQGHNGINYIACLIACRERAALGMCVVSKSRAHKHTTPGLHGTPTSQTGRWQVAALHSRATVGITNPLAISLPISNSFPCSLHNVICSLPHLQRDTQCPY